MARLSRCLEALALCVPARVTLHTGVVLVGVVFLGCAPKALGPLDATHPASPEAAEAVLQEPGTVLSRPGPETAREREAPAPPMSHGPGMTHGKGRAAGVEEEAGAIYVCPMHPDVRRPGPGKCPRCGMSLVKRGGSQGEEGGHAH